MTESPWPWIRSRIYARYEAQKDDKLVVCLIPKDYSALIADPDFYHIMLGSVRNQEGEIVFLYNGIECTIRVTRKEFDWDMSRTYGARTVKWHG